MKSNDSYPSEMKIFGLSIPHSRSNKRVLDKLDELKGTLEEIGYLLPRKGENAFLMSPEKYFLIPSDKYVESARNCLSRIVLSKSDATTPEEKKAMKYLSNHVFESSVVLFTKFNKNSFLEPHYHSFAERIIIVRGSVKVTLSKDTMHAGDQIDIPAFVVHQFMGLEDGFAITIIKKEP